IREILDLLEAFDERVFMQRVMAVLESSWAVVFNKVHAEGQMFDANELDHVIHVSQHVLDPHLAFRDALGERQNPYQTPLLRNGLDLIVREIAGVIEHAAGIGMAHEQRRSGRVERVEKPFAVHMREIDDHAQTIRLFDHFDAEISQAAAGAVFPYSVTELVAKIPNRLQRPESQSVKIS